MKKYLMLLVLASSTAFAQDVKIWNNEFGSGIPGSSGYTNAVVVGNEIDLDIYHAPQFLPFYPTAATIWPRVVEVPCKTVDDGVFVCQGYQWYPGLGRAEYLFFKPTTKMYEPEPQVIIKEVQTPPIIIEVEVERKNKKN